MDPHDPINPYAPPEAADLARPVEVDAGSAEAIRRELYRHEASLKSAACLQLSCGFFFLVCLVFGTLGMIVSLGAGGSFGPFELGRVFGVVAVYGGLAALMLTSGYGLWKLAPWAKVPATLAWVLGLIMPPLVGTALGLYVFYLLYSDKGQRVLSEEYGQVVAATPQIRYVPWLLIVLMILVALLVVGSFVVASARF